MPRVVSYERNPVNKCGRGNPCVRVRRRTAPPALDLSPFPAHGIFVRQNGVALEMLPKSDQPLLAPVALQRPAIELGDGHEGNSEVIAFQDLPIGSGQRVFLEDVGDNGSVDDEPVHSSSQDEVRRQRSRASSKPSSIWSAGQPPARSSRHSAGRTPCWRARSSQEVCCQNSLARKSISSSRVVSFSFGTGMRHLLSPLIYTNCRIFARPSHPASRP